MICPCCGKTVRKNHFACEKASAAGQAGTGTAKKRGDSAHYKAIRAKRTNKKKEP